MTQSERWSERRSQDRYVRDYGHRRDYREDPSEIVMLKGLPATIDDTHVYVLLYIRIAVVSFIDACFLLLANDFGKYFLHTVTKSTTTFHVFLSIDSMLIPMTCCYFKSWY